MRKFITLIALVIISTTSFAQSLVAVSYNMSFPMGDAAEYIGETSFRGLAIDGKTFISDNFTAGISGGWNTFYEKLEEDTYNKETVSITGTQFRYINTSPILATAHYYTGSSESGLRIFAGIGVGTYYIQKKTEMGIWALTESLWHFGFAPEVGVLLPTPFVNINVSVKYNYALSADDSIDYNWIGLNLGFAWNQ